MSVHLGLVQLSLLIFEYQPIISPLYPPHVVSGTFDQVQIVSFVLVKSGAVVDIHSHVLHPITHDMTTSTCGLQLLWPATGQTSIIALQTGKQEVPDEKVIVLH